MTKKEVVEVAYYLLKRWCSRSAKLGPNEIITFFGLCEKNSSHSESGSIMCGCFVLASHWWFALNNGPPFLAIYWPFCKCSKEQGKAVRPARLEAAFVLSFFLSSSASAAPPPRTHILRAQTRCELGERCKGNAFYLLPSNSI